MPAHPASLRDSLAYAHAADPFGHPVHLALATSFAFVLPLGMVPVAKDVILAALFVCLVCRFPKIHRCLRAPFRDPWTWLIFAWPAWMLVSLAWSPAPEYGAEELRMCRMLLLLPLLWPVMLHYRIIISGFLAGCCIVVMFQMGQVIGAAGLHLDIQDRADAMMQPILAGAFLVTAATWFLAGTLLWDGRRSVAMAAGLIIVTVGLVLTGSRGPWVSLAVTATLLVIATFALVPLSRRRIAALGGLATLAIIGVILLDVLVLSGRFTNPVRARIETALLETDSSSGDDHYDIALGGWHRTPVGYRLLAWEAARDVFLAHPVFGTGAGGLSHSLDDSWWLSAPDSTDPVSQQHLNPHSMYLQVLASTGVIGLLLLLTPIVFAISRLLTKTHDPCFFGAAFVAVAWASGAAFDGYQMMTSMVAVLMLVYLAAMASRGTEPETAA